MSQCPRCDREAEHAGVTHIDAQPPLDVYQCDHCIVDWHVEGTRFDAALTWYVDAAGVARDPSTGKPIT